MGGALARPWPAICARLCQPEDRVAIAMTNRPEFLEALFAIWHAGLVAVPMNAKLHSEEFGYIIGDTEAALVLASPDRADDVARHGRTIVDRRRDWRELCGATASIWCRGGRAISPGSSIPAAPPAGPKARCSTHGIMMAQTLAYFAEIEPVAAARLCPARGADVARLRLLRPALCRHGQQRRRSRKRRLRAGRDRGAACASTAMSVSSRRRPW